MFMGTDLIEYMTILLILRVQQHPENLERETLHELNSFCNMLNCRHLWQMSLI